MSSSFSSLLSLVTETFVDMTQNQVSTFVCLVLLVIMAALLAAHFSNETRLTLVKIKFLEADESPMSLLVWIIGIVIAVKIFQAFVVQPFIVDGASMVATFHDKEFLLVDKLSYHTHTPARGDVVIFKLYENTPNNYAGKYLIKRLIGLPGERIVVKDAVTTIYNTAHPEGFVISEPYVTYKDTFKDIDTTLSESEYFVMGDNRKESYDSRSWGPLQQSYLRGKVLVRVLPFKVFSIHPGKYIYDK